MHQVLGEEVQYLECFIYQHGSSNVDMIQAQCSIAVLKTFFLWIFRVFSLLSIQQIDNIFQLSIHALLIIEMTPTEFKTDGKILFAM